MNPNVGSYIPSTQVWDVNEIYSATQDPKLQELFIRLYQNLNRMALATNIKDAGYYVDQEFVNGQSFFPSPSASSATFKSQTLRQVFRKVVNFGALPNAGTKSVVHGITIAVDGGGNTVWSFTRIYGCASKQAPALSFIPLPYASSTLNENIKLTVDATNVSIVTAIDYSAYTVCYVILEYIKT